MNWSQGKLDKWLNIIVAVLTCTHTGYYDTLASENGHDTGYPVIMVIIQWHIIPIRILLLHMACYQIFTKTQHYYYCFFKGNKIVNIPKIAWRTLKSFTGPMKFTMIGHSTTWCKKWWTTAAVICFLILKFRKTYTITDEKAKVTWTRKKMSGEQEYPSRNLVVSDTWWW